MTDILWTRPDTAARGTFVFAHGAGAAMDSPFMTTVAEMLAADGIASARFEFPYMAERRNGGKKRPPPRAEKLIPVFLDVLAEILPVSEGRVLIGGKSMGGRIAAMVGGEEALAPRVVGVACLGYPFHAPGKPEAMRLDPLTGARVPVLILQGERDPFGNRSEVNALNLPASVNVIYLSDGDHDLAPRGRAEATRTGNLREAAAAIAGFLDRRAG